MRINRGLLGWGVFIVLVGAVPLAVRAGLVTADQVGRVWSLWPLIVIGIGLSILLARSRLAFLGGLVVSATLGLMLGGVLSGGVDGFAGSACGPDRGATAFPARDGVFEARAEVSLEFDCGELFVTARPGNAWSIEGEDSDGSGVSVDATSDSLSVDSADRADGPFGVLGGRETWRVALPTEVALEVDLELNAGSSVVDLAGARLDSISLDLNAGSAVLDLEDVEALGSLGFQVNAGSLDLTLPNRSVTGSIEVNAGSVSLCIPAGTAIRLDTANSIVSGFDFEDQGLEQQGSTWQTPGFDQASVRIDLQTQANAGSFSLNPEDGCHG